MDNNSQIIDLINMSIKTIDKVDKLNQRLITCIIAMTVSFYLCICLTIVGLAYFYFTTDYNYGTVNQNQTNTENSNQNINKGGNY